MAIEPLLEVDNSLINWHSLTIVSAGYTINTFQNLMMQGTELVKGRNSLLESTFWGGGGVDEYSCCLIVRKGCLEKPALK